jgi:GNAT superfamily N-acetyltransferase
VPLTVSPKDRLRPATPGDADALAQLRYEFRAALDPVTEPAAAFVERCAEWMRRQLAPGTAWHAWLIERDGQLVGTVWLELFEKLPNPIAERECHGYITNLYVRAEGRRAGLGTILLQAALAECEARGVDAVLLWPTTRSRRLYQRHGFQTAGDLLERRLAGAPQHPLDTG